MSNLTLKPTVEQEVAKIKAALNKARLNKGEAAKLLGISRRTLYTKMKLYEKEIFNEN